MESRQNARDLIADGVARVQRRGVQVLFWRQFARALFYAGLAGAVTLVLQPTIPVVTVLLTVACGSLIFAAAATWMRAPDREAAAKQYDDAGGLKDRLSSSIELAGETGPMVNLLLDEAGAAMARLDPRKAYPLQLTREGRLLPVSAAALAAAFFLPGMWTQPPMRDEALAAVVDPQVAELKKFVARERAKDPSAGKRELLRELEQLTTELARPDLKKKDALAEISKLMKEIEDKQKQDEQKKADLEKLIKNFQANDKTRQLADEMNRGKYDDAANKLQELIDELKEKIKKLQQQKPDSEELKKLQNELRKLEEVKAQLMALRNVRISLKNAKDILEFLGQFEGSIGALPDDEVVDGEPCANPGCCSKPSDSRPVIRIHQRLLERQKGAGRATMPELYDEKPERTKGTTEEHQITVKEQKGKSSFTQTQVANDGSKSKLSEREVLQAEKRQAEETIQREEIPAGYSRYVRRYFDRIQPDESGGK